VGDARNPICGWAYPDPPHGGYKKRTVEKDTSSNRKFKPKAIDLRGSGFPYCHYLNF